MNTQKNILIVKYGALGDVVRTSFFAKPLRTQIESNNANIKLYWLTAPQSVPLLRFNPYIDVVTTDPSEIKNVEFDTIYSLDDESDILDHVSRLRANKIVGASFDSHGNKIYCDQSACWFDMGLLSRYGKERADELKRLNHKTHSELFKNLFQVDNVDFNFYNSSYLNSSTNALLQQMSGGKIAIGLNAFAGKRWPAKALPDVEFPKLVRALSSLTINNQSIHLFLIGSGLDLQKNKDYLKGEGIPTNVSALDTDSNILDLAAAVGSMKLLVSTDSLCLHLAVGQQVPTISFFAPTSAAEIEDLAYTRKVKSLSNDYCNYKPNADNSTITSERIMQEVTQLLGTLNNA